MASSFEDGNVATDLLTREIARRRTFAIISHPDAGKTTLTEKLLLYAGAIELAGAVRGSKTQRHAVSDWMEMEQQRGISISAAALEFELQGHHVTLLDTPATRTSAKIPTAPCSPSTASSWCSMRPRASSRRR